MINKIDTIPKQNKINVLIYGAGEWDKVRSKPKYKFYNVVAFIDDNKSLQGKIINKMIVYKKITQN